MRSLSVKVCLRKGWTDSSMLRVGSVRTKRALLYLYMSLSLKDTFYGVATSVVIVGASPLALTLFNIVSIAAVVVLLCE